MPALLRLILAFIKVGAVSFGGGWTTVGLMRTEVVGGGMMTDEGFRQAVAISQITPGPVALNMATLAGWDVAGWAGALLATFAVVLVPVLLVAALAILSSRVKVGGPALQEALRIGALAMTALTVWSLSAPDGLSWRLYAFSAVSCLAVLKTKINPSFVILGCGALNVALAALFHLA